MNRVFAHGVMMFISDSLDCGILPAFKVVGNTLRFNLTLKNDILNVLVGNPPPELRVELTVAGKAPGFLLRQGLIVSTDGTVFRPIPLKEMDEGVLTAGVTTGGSDVRISTRYPFGRDGLDRLIGETSGRNGCAWQFLRQDGRVVPLVQFGTDDGAKMVHYVIAGEDAWETAGSLTAAAMIRELATHGWDEDSVIRLVPLVSPCSATSDCASYRTPAGENLYGAATWGDEQPPPEFACLKNMVEKTVAEGRCGLVLTIHSWQAQSLATGMETIRTAGRNTLSGPRACWAEETMANLMRDVPAGEYVLAEKIWHPGLARDYLLARHNVISFRVEITTADNGPDGFIRTGECFVKNIRAVGDWQSVHQK